MILLPIGPLAETGLLARLVAAAVAAALFYLTRRNLLVGVTAGTIALIALAS